jgi:hypothetical protein
MNLDVRLPMGSLFSILGAMVLIYGLVNSLRLDIEWGGAMLVFGVICLGLALHAMNSKGKSTPAPVAETVKVDE